jgi:hypothetical protein
VARNQYRIAIDMPGCPLLLVTDKDGKTPPRLTQHQARLMFHNLYSVLLFEGFCLKDVSQIRVQGFSVK